jgi:glucose-6-phosphate isomerase
MLISKTEEWKNLAEHKNEIEKIEMLQLFNENPKRFDEFSIKFNEILFDYSKNILTEKTKKLLLKLAEKANLKEKIEEMFNGEKINSTENRAVLHTALRFQINTKANEINKNAEIIVDGENIIPKIQQVLAKMFNFVDKIHSSEILSFSGKKFTDIVNIGIGGSDLGPAMVCEALKYYKIAGINSHFVSNVDGTDILSTCAKLNPETTLFIVASKTFTTQETLANANTAKKWILSEFENKFENNDDFQQKKLQIISKHFVALSTNIPACKEFGINPENVFEFWDWVGGRYSLWAAIGLSIALSVGTENFKQLLKGGFEMDLHFRNAEFGENIPVIMALLGIWYSNFFAAKTHCVVPYDQFLSKFPAFLQQLDMESNGKHITKAGENVDFQTGSVIWGEIGTNAQHSFFQLLHQGTQLIPVDFIAFANYLQGNNINDINKKIEQFNEEADEHHKILLSNFFAQTEALMKGKNENEVLQELKKVGKSENEIKNLLPHKIFTGNKPTNTLLIDKLTPKTLGMLIALYEHKVFVQGAIWNVNQFDQWGVELGKQLAKSILPELNNDETISSHDNSTNGLINYYKKMKNK